MSSIMEKCLIEFVMYTFYSLSKLIIESIYTMEKNKAFSCTDKINDNSKINEQRKEVRIKMKIIKYAF